MEDEIIAGLGNGNQMDSSKLLVGFNKSFIQVQSILDQNRLLINEINRNHESNLPDNLSRNVGLIRELNNNIRRVVHLYSGLSTSFAGSTEASSDSATADGRPRHKRIRPELC